MAVLQIVVNGATLFILYRFLLSTIGATQLGIWSLVLAMSAVSQIASFGLSGSVIKFVAKYIAREEPENASIVVQTATISIAAFLCVTAPIAYPCIAWVLGRAVPHESLPLALSILPHAVVALSVMLLNGVIQGGLDGCSRIDLRNLILMGGTVTHLLLCLVLVPRYGLMGAAWARVVNGLGVCIVVWVLLRSILPVLPLIPLRWDRRTFREIIGYGANFQIISICYMLYDPITKALLSRFGSLPMVAYYDMASRLANLCQTLIVSANQVLVPTIAMLRERAPEKIQAVYTMSYRTVFYLALPSYTLIVAYTPIISEFWIGRYEPIFVTWGMLLALGYLFNTLNAPAYTAYQGIGTLRWNAVSRVVTAVLNLGLGFLFGAYFGGIGVVVGWIVAFALGSVIICVSYHLTYKISLTTLLPKESIPILSFCLAGVVFDILINRRGSHVTLSLTPAVINALVFSVVIFLSGWRHPMRRLLLNWSRMRF
jgi:O-antigen/teichoic acid export membrane protein